MREAKFGEYQGKKLIVLPIGKDGDREFSFGLGKAKAIVENIEAVKKFVETEGEALK